MARLRRNATILSALLSHWFSRRRAARLPRRQQSIQEAGAAKGCAGAVLSFLREPVPVAKRATHRVR
jgi:hypothetical protein